MNFTAYKTFTSKFKDLGTIEIDSSPINKQNIEKTIAGINLDNLVYKPTYALTRKHNLAAMGQICHSRHLT